MKKGKNVADEAHHPKQWQLALGCVIFMSATAGNNYLPKAPSPSGMKTEYSIKFPYPIRVPSG
jgi:hypothetical protein